MKKTLRLMGIIALAMLALAGCKKNEQQTTGSLTAKLTQPTGNSKTHIGTDGWLRWNENDAIKVFDAEGTAYSFTTTDNDTVEATFDGETGIYASQAYTAFYPAENTTDLTGDYVYLTLPATQTYADGTFANNTYPMLATNEGSGTTFTFHSPCGVLAIPMKGTAAIGNIVLTDKSNAPLAGQMKINPEGLNPTDFTYTMESPSTSITLNCGGLTLSDDSVTVVFVVPAGVFGNGFTAIINDTNNQEIYTLATTKDNTIVKEFITTMTPAVTIQDLVVTTSAATSVEYTTATINGSFDAQLGMEVTEVGFKWGAGADLSHTETATMGTGTSFSFNLTGLTEGTEYSFQAYAKNGSIEKTGAVLTFTTPSSIPAGAIDGKFIINSAGQQIYFSRGSLQYQASTGTWRFAEHQWDYVGNASYGTVYEGGVKCNNNLISSTYSGWIDLFGWGTSGWNSGAIAYMPYSTSATVSHYYPGGNANNDLTGSCAEADWAWHNAISNGGNAAHQWRTLTEAEWEYLLFDRTNTTNLATANARFARGMVNNVNGLILFPNGYEHPAEVTAPVAINNTAYNGSSGSGNNYSIEAWGQMEGAGAVFLPQAGHRVGTGANAGTATYTYYCTSTHGNNYMSQFLVFNYGLSHGLSQGFLYTTATYRYTGGTVRPVQVYTPGGK